MQLETNSSQKSKKVCAHNDSFPEGQRSKKLYYVCIEGEKYAWSDKTITTEQIAHLGGWDTSLGVIEIDKYNNERTLQPGEIIELKPGHGFSKKVCWKRGLNAIDERIQAELILLKNKYPDRIYIPEGQWILIKRYKYGEGWSPSSGPVVFQIPPNGYPGNPPYGIYVRVGLKFKGQTPNNYKEPAPVQPPFEGQWGILSWSSLEGYWRPAATVKAGSNLLNFVDGFAVRFKEGL